MAGRPQECSLGAAYRKAQSMIDCACRNLIITYQAWEDRQAGCVSGCPGFRTQGIRVQIPNCSTTAFPAAVALRISSKHFVQLTGSAIDDDNMAIATAQSPAFNWCLRRNGIWPGIAFVGVVEVYWHKLLVARHHDVGDTDRRA